MKRLIEERLKMQLTNGGRVLTQRKWDSQNLMKNLSLPKWEIKWRLLLLNQIPSQIMLPPLFNIRNMISKPHLLKLKKMMKQELKFLGPHTSTQMERKYLTFLQLNQQNLAGNATKLWKRVLWSLTVSLNIPSVTLNALEPIRINGAFLVKTLFKRMRSMEMLSLASRPKSSR